MGLDITKLKSHLASITKEEFQKEWVEIKALNLDSISMKDFNTQNNVSNMKMSAYNELVEKAKLYNHLGLGKAEEELKKACGNEYPEPAIEIALFNARGLYMPRSISELMYLFANSEEYQQLEQDIFSAIKKLFVLLIDFDKMHNINAKQSNEILERVSKHLTSNLFNILPLHKNI
jgi:hypothetical protein